VQALSFFYCYYLLQSMLCSGALDSAFAELHARGHFVDPVKRAVEEVFLPWLRARVCIYTTIHNSMIAYIYGRKGYRACSGEATSKVSFQPSLTLLLVMFCRTHAIFVIGSCESLLFRRVPNVCTPLRLCCKKYLHSHSNECGCFCANEAMMQFLTSCR